MTRRARAIAIALRRRPEPSPWLLWVMLALLLLFAIAARAQMTGGTAGTQPPVANAPVPTKPLQTDPTQMQGVLVPTEPVDPDIRAAAPPAAAFPMPVVKPPGTPGGNLAVIPK